MDGAAAALLAAVFLPIIQVRLQRRGVVRTPSASWIADRSAAGRLIALKDADGNVIGLLQEASQG